MLRKSAKAKSAKTPKDIVKEKYSKSAACIEARPGRFHICVKTNDEDKPIHSGFAENHNDAWKLAAHQII